MKPVAFAQGAPRMPMQSRSGVEQAICDIHRPRGKRQQQRHPRRQMHAPGPGKSQRPHDGHGGRVEAGQMPEADGSRSIVDLLHCLGTARDALWRRCQNEGKRHNLDFRAEIPVAASWPKPWLGDLRPLQSYLPNNPFNAFIGFC